MSSPPVQQTRLFPPLCHGTGLLALVLVGELIALAVVLLQSPIEDVSWVSLGYSSMVVQWIVLCSALLLCQLNTRLPALSPQWVMAASYVLVLFVSLVVLCLAQWIAYRYIDFLVVLQYMIITAIFAGILLRYLFVQQQLRLQQQAELQARIQALHARIRPHFLFNAMNALASLIATDPVKAEQLVEDLCQVFRMSLREVSVTALAKELQLCRHYLAIEQVRLSERLHIHWQFNEQILTCMVPSMILQPLLENAVYHGIQPLKQGGTVTIVMQVIEQELRIDISNPMPWPAVASQHQLALTNIRHRLQAHYGHQASIKVEARPPSEINQASYHVCLCLPFQEGNM